jgi:hypothetical protein
MKNSAKTLSDSSSLDYLISIAQKTDSINFSDLKKIPYSDLEIFFEKIKRWHIYGGNNLENLK